MKKFGEEIQSQAHAEKLELKEKEKTKVFEFRILVIFDPKTAWPKKTVENQKVTTRHIIESDILNIIKSELELRVKLITEEI